MPSPRRLRLLVLAALAITVMILYYTSKLDDQAGRDGRTIQDFYHKTVNAMEGKLAPAQAMLDKTGSKAGKVPADRDGDGDVDADDEESAIKMQERLKAAEQKAKDKANEKGGLRPDPPSKMVGVGSSAEGQKKGVGKGKSAQEVAEEIQEPKSEDELKAEKELNAILKRSPVIIFSKSYCPFSKRAKGILLEKYSITPDPYVVELDEHPQGPQLQDQLKENTGRRTVPNVLINGVSIGGADEIVALDNDDQLVGKIVDLGNKRVNIVERLGPH